MQITVNRVVTILTPLVFAPAAAFVTAWVGKHAPGLPAIKANQLVALEISGATFAFGIAYKWLHGSQQWDSIRKDLAIAGLNVAALAPAAPVSVDAPSLSLDPADQPPAVTTPASVAPAAPPAATAAPVPPAAT